MVVDTQHILLALKVFSQDTFVSSDVK